MRWPYFCAVVVEVDEAYSGSYSCLHGRTDLFLHQPLFTAVVSDGGNVVIRNSLFLEFPYQRFANTNFWLVMSSPACFAIVFMKLSILLTSSGATEYHAPQPLSGVR